MVILGYRFLEVRLIVCLSTKATIGRNITNIVNRGKEL